MAKSDKPKRDEEEPEQPLFTDKRRVDPETGDVRPEAAPAASGEQITEEDLELLAETERDLVFEYRDRAARAEAELQNFRMRVERDRQANREAVVAEVIRALLPVMDDLDRADAHGDLAGGPLEMVAKKLRSSFERYGLTAVGEWAKFLTQPNTRQWFVFRKLALWAKPWQMSSKVDTFWVTNWCAQPKWPSKFRPTSNDEGGVRWLARTG